MIKAVFFGSLACLTDLVELERMALNQTFAMRDLPFSWSETSYNNLLMKHGRFEAPSTIIQNLPGSSKKRFIEDLEENFRALIDDADLKLHPWTSLALEKLRQKDIKAVLVSGAERQTTLRVLAAVLKARASITFDFVTSSEMARFPKPAPDLYSIAVDATGTSLNDVLTIETTLQGLQSAKDVGLSTTILPGPFTRDDILDKADVTFSEDIEHMLEAADAKRFSKFKLAENSPSAAFSC